MENPQARRTSLQINKRIVERFILTGTPNAIASIVTLPNVSPSPCIESSVTCLL